MATDTEGLITSLYNGIILRDPTDSELAYWKGEIDIGVITPVGLVIAGAATPEFTGVNLKIAMIFEAAFGRYATNEELQTWKTIYDTGLTLADMGQRFVTSSEFSSKHPAGTTTADYLQALADSGLGRDVTQTELDIITPLIDSGTMDYGDILQLIIDNNGRETKVGLAMLSAALNNAAPEAAAIEALDLSSIPAAVNTLILDSHFYTPDSTGAPTLSEIDGELTIVGPTEADIVLNLSTGTVTIDDVAQALARGNLSDVTTVDATGLTGGKVIFTGRAEADTYLATAAGDTINGAAGDDSLSGGSGADTFVFAATAAANGLDIITGFARSADNSDILDFSAFLQATGTDQVATVVAESSGAVSWANGDVLVVSGYDLTSAGDLAALFGDGLPFAAPTARGKAVVIAADIVGDAAIWYLVNQTGLTAVTASELTQVATLAGVNNLELVGFTADNFA